VAAAGLVTGIMLAVSTSVMPALGRPPDAAPIDAQIAR
jgi:uncharacterized membrane protein